jgi:hypothetical protein
MYFRILGKVIPWCIIMMSYVSIPPGFDNTCGHSAGRLWRGTKHGNHFARAYTYPHASAAECRPLLATECFPGDRL